MDTMLRRLIAELRVVRVRRGVYPARRADVAFPVCWHSQNKWRWGVREVNGMLRWYRWCGELEAEGKIEWVKDTGYKKKTGVDRYDTF